MEERGHEEGNGWKGVECLVEGWRNGVVVGEVGGMGVGGWDVVGEGGGMWGRGVLVWRITEWWWWCVVGQNKTRGEDGIKSSWAGRNEMEWNGMGGDEWVEHLHWVDGRRVKGVTTVWSQWKGTNVVKWEFMGAKYYDLEIRDQT
jgi:hypothetical protein